MVGDANTNFKKDEAYQHTVIRWQLTGLSVTQMILVTENGVLNDTDLEAH